MEIQVNDQVSMQSLHPGHAQVLFELTDLNRDYLRQWVPWLDSTVTVKDTDKFIQSAIEQDESGQGPQFAIFYHGSMCGVIGFHKIDRPNRIAAIGYWLARSHTGKGIITLAAQELLSLGFRTYNLNKLEIHCAQDNERSRAVAERLGFKYEATLRQCEWLYDRYVDHAIYSLLAAEFCA